MNTFLINYDLNTPRKNYQLLYGVIKSLGKCQRYQRSGWLVRSKLSGEQIYARLKACTSRSDYLLILEVNLSSAFGRLPKRSEKWTPSTPTRSFADIKFLSDFDDKTKD